MLNSFPDLLDTALSLKCEAPRLFFLHIFSLISLQTGSQAPVTSLLFPPLPFGHSRRIPAAPEPVQEYPFNSLCGQPS